MWTFLASPLNLTNQNRETAGADSRFWLMNYLFNWLINLLIMVNELSKK